MSSALKIHNLSCKYAQQTVLNTLNLDVNNGEIICLLGASGCGKTTLLKAIAGLLPISSGQVFINGRLMDDGEKHLPTEQRNIGLIFQDYALFPHLTVAQNIQFGLQGMTKEEKSSVTQRMLELVHLQELGNRYPHQLSGGQQQRVAIARSLAYQPDLLLLDEPFSNIDTQVRHELISEIRKLFKEQGITAIFVTHSREEAFAFSDKMAVMNEGMIEQFGTASELYFSPASRFVADFLGGGTYIPATKVSPRHFSTEFGEVETAIDDSLSVGQKGQLFFRPHHVSLCHSSSSSYYVNEQQFMGDHCRYIVNIDGIKLTGIAETAISVGQAVDIRLQDRVAIAFN
ncbi:ABC transporter ATP-binding protein [Vibrio viridaestus]|uniref:ABC transporter ATP-binding protein n=1 Tax=Vibrio viridaestus TaxID=2487322 RepID=A0A3N9U2T6_9VIBR|nr:ABC transporter ATP-binding protein [Vibrio viridaestus]RQW63842.1 ABC transporter ATP-binding protein [Vibrio viridaestus]